MIPAITALTQMITDVLSGFVGYSIYSEEALLPVTPTYGIIIESPSTFSLPFVGATMTIKVKVFAPVDTGISLGANVSTHAETVYSLMQALGNLSENAGYLVAPAYSMTEEVNLVGEEAQANDTDYLVGEFEVTCGIA